MKIVHKSGNKNVVADALSRIEGQAPSEELNDLIEFEFSRALHCGPVINQTTSYEQDSSVVYRRIIPYILNLRDSSGGLYRVNIQEQQHKDPYLDKIFAFLKKGVILDNLPLTAVESTADKWKNYYVVDNGCLSLSNL